jgi:hypothetical protein
MKVIISNTVREKVREFYIAAMRNHPSLSWETVTKKELRLFESLQMLETVQGFRVARVDRRWIEHGWREYICEDFHFAYEICTDENGEDFVWVRDAVHSLLYY